jgi:hypothetical protein
LRFKKEGLKLSNTIIDQFDEDGMMVMYSHHAKRGRIALELFNIKDSSITQNTIKNDNFDESQRIRLLRRLQHNQLLLIVDKAGESERYEAVFLIMDI